MTLILQPGGQFASEGRFACSLETSKHDHRRGGLGELQSSGLTAENLDEFFVDDLHNLLSWIERFRYLGTQGPFFDSSTECPDHW